MKELPPQAPSTEPRQRQKPHPQSSLHPSLKVPCRRALLHVPQTRPLWKGMPVSRAFSTYPSGSPARKPSLQVLFTELPQRETPHLQSPIQPSLKVPGRRALLQVPQTGPLWKEMPVSRAFHTYLQGSQQGSPPSRFPSQSSHRERHHISRAPFNHISKSPVDEPIPGCPTEPP